MIDSHCHLADPAFADDLDEVVGRARAAGVSDGLCVVELGDAAQVEQARRAAGLWPGLRFAVGVYPHEASRFDGREDDIAEALQAARAALPGVCALGEMGLDYHHDLSPRDVQRAVFRVQVRVAAAAGLPVVVHTREADEETVAILEDEGHGAVTGVFHCFTGTAELAERALAMGFLISFSGILTFAGAEPLRDVAAGVPLDRLLVETDCPYLAPVPMRGRRNEPAWVTHTAAVLAGRHGVSVEELDAHVTTNFARLLGP